MSQATLKSRMLAGDMLSGTFMKTPAFQLVEILAMSGMDFVALDAEHAPFDRGAVDACLGMARALNFPALVRIPDDSPAQILTMLDSGATGLVVPHVNTAEKARDIARAARFGHGGRGFAGSSRWAGYATRKMPDILKQSDTETVVLAQIEEPEAVDDIDEIAAVEGIDALFVGPADLALCYGLTDPAAPEVRLAIRRVGEAAKKHGKCLVTFAPNTSWVPDLKALGVTMYFIASEHSYILDGAKAVAEDIRKA
ncbi:aldolase/citrate lyase family protein [Thalassospiraceae bacterium LMO-JJ14]|nr:aldolase/citrate lyase family protein [Thalassospiraceae bacterium LMO-JJ14]